ncbi:MAG: FAD-dependent oxidoreductase [Lawsonella clevelandensis]
MCWRHARRYDRGVAGGGRTAALGAASLRHWPGFGGKLNANHPNVFTSTAGTLNVGVDEGDVEDLEKIYQYVTAAGGSVGPRRHHRWGSALLAPGSDNPVDARMRKITRRELRTLEPSFSRAARAALLTEGERSVDNRELLAALREQCEGTYGVTLCERQIDDLHDLVNGKVGNYDQVVLAAGNGSQALAATVGLNLPIRPIKGEVLRLHFRPGVPEPPKRTIRGRVHGRPIYLVPRPWVCHRRH